MIILPLIKTVNRIYKITKLKSLSRYTINENRWRIQSWGQVNEHHLVEFEKPTVFDIKLNTYCRPNRLKVVSFFIKLDLFLWSNLTQTYVEPFLFVYYYNTLFFSSELNHLAQKARSATVENYYYNHYYYCYSLFITLYLKRMKNEVGEMNISVMLQL